MEDLHPPLGNTLVETFRVGGIHVTIWKNTGPVGVWHVAEFAHRDQDRHDHWPRSQSFGATDLLSLATAVDRAYHAIAQLDPMSRRESPPWWARVLTMVSRLKDRVAALRRLDEAGVIDRLTELRFLCDLKEYDYDACDQAALAHFDAETTGVVY